MNTIQRCVFLAAALLWVLPAAGQSIVGPTLITIGQTTTYTYTASSSVSSPSWTTAKQAATIVSTSQNGLVYSVNIAWTDVLSGTDQVIFLSGSTSVSQLSVLVNCTSPPATPSITFTISSNLCGDKTISYTATPGSGIAWYWQTDPNGISTSNSTQSFTATTSGTYYVRAKKTTSNCWSTSTAQVTVTVNVIPATPAAFSVSTNTCDAKTLTSGGGLPGIIWFWQGTDPLGTSTANASTTYIVNTSGTYYLRAQSSEGCWSNASRSASVTVINTPPAPTTATNSTSFKNGTPTVSVGAVSGATSYKWYLGITAVPGVSTASYQPTGFTATTTWQVSALNSTCESAGQKDVILTVLNDPQLIVSNGGKPAIVMGRSIVLGTSEAYDTYTWKDAGNQVIGNAATLSVSQPGTYTVTVTRSGVSGTGISLPFQVYAGLESQDMNYIVSNTVLTNTVTDPSVLNNLAVESVSQTIQYFDELGRPVQTVGTQNSPAKMDVIQPVVYDEFGRENIKYLPYVSSEFNGWYKANPVGTSGNYASSPQYSFYNNSSTLVTQSQKPFAEVTFEASPLSRVLKQGAPGEDWQPDATADYTSSDHTIKKSYDVNAAREVLLFKSIAPNVTNTMGFIKPGNDLYYRANQLQKNRTKDEQGNEVIEFIDKEGRTVLKKVQADATTYAQTYYIYNDIGNLVCVLQPEATKYILSVLPVSWVNRTGASLGVSNLLTKTSASGYGNSGATSTQTLAANTDGWVEMVAGETNTSRMIGLAQTNVNAGTSIQYALELRNDGKIYVWENGVAGANLGDYTNGTVVRVSREGTQVKYYVNGVYKQTSATASTTSLLADVALDHIGATIKDVNISFTVNANMSSILNNYAFLYTYDGRRRMAQKQVPGASPVYMVYDGRDRLVLTQDGVQRGTSPKRWLFTKYDELNRPIATGIKDTAEAVTQAAMQAVVDAHYTKPWAKWGETYIGNDPKNMHGYSNFSYPVVVTISATDFTKYMTITYYDTYDFRSLWISGYNYVNDGLSQTVNGVSYQQPGSENVNVRGKVTGTKVKVLDGSVIGGFTWLKSVNYYDDKYRVIQTKSDNYKGGNDRISNLYDFTGKVLKTRTTHAENDVTWTAIGGATVNGSKLLRTVAGNSWGVSGAASVQQLPAGEDGWVEFITTETSTRKMVGLADSNPDLSYESIDYAFYMNQTSLVIYENNLSKYTATTPLTAGEVLRIERSAGVVRYYRNDMTTPVHTSATASSTILMVDAALWTSAATITGVRTSFGSNTLTVNRRFEYDHAGRLTSTFHSLGNPVTWTSLINTTATGNTLTKTGGLTTAWDAGAFSQQSIAAGKDGWVEWKAQETNTAKMLGFSDSNVNTNYTSIDYAMYARNNGEIAVYENGAAMGTYATYTVNDLLRIERKNGVIYYKKNGEVIYTSTVASSTVLYADCSLFTSGGTIGYVYMGEGLGASEVELARNEYNELGQLIDKKLHSASATAFKQSVDYRYNIRGWLTSMNNASLSNDGTTNDDTGDYFGMNLGYNINIGPGNSPLYNGNISAMRWSNFLGQATVKEKSYMYSYDPMNRITGANFKEKTTTWNMAANKGFSEAGYTYDLNGNILTLNRRDKRGNTAVMDSLTYNYGTTAATQGNRLLKVADAGDDFAGFTDGTNSTNDYGYDDNGNMTTDQNKGITTAITYNYLNLPELITRGSNTVRYIYDATGRKLSQVTTFSGTTKQSDYSGEFTYENDVLQFLSHEEGRVVVNTPQLIYTNPGESTGDMTASNATLATVTQNGTEKYVKATSNGTVARTGVFPIGAAYPVVAGERYRIRAKGYRDKGTAASSNPAYLLIQASGTDLGWVGAALPSSATTAQTESWIEQTVTIPAGATTLQAGVVWNTVLAGEIIYLNEFEITKLESTAPEYQYNLKDHLGNVRLTFTTKSETNVSLATLETANASKEQGEFLYYDEAIKVDYAPFDHTNAGPTYYSTRLTGGNTNAKYGLTKTLSVMPGDVVSMEVYAKYLDLTSSNWTAALNNFITAMNGGTAPAGTIVDGGAAGSIGGGTYPISGIDHTSETGTPPKAYLNYIVFDRTMTNVLNMGYARITASSREYGQDGPHDRLALSYNVKEPGYVYIYLSNETPTEVEVYFDDFKVTHIQSPVIQTDDYYPFGLAYNSFSRENNAPNKIKFQGQEHIDDLNLAWDSFKWRNHQPEIGRFFNVDPLTEKYVHNSPYAFSENKVTSHIELEGLEAVDPKKEEASKANPQALKDQQNLLVNFFQNISTFFTRLGSTYNNVTGNRDADEDENFRTGATVVVQLMTAPLEVEQMLAEGAEASSATNKIDDFANQAKNVATKVDDIAIVAAKMKGPIVGGGAKLEYLGNNVNRIQNIARKYSLEISVVGSRAKGTANARSDWDYIITGGNSKTRSSALFQLPKNLSAVKNGVVRPGSEILKGVSLDPNLPHITFKISY